MADLLGGRVHGTCGDEVVLTDCGCFIVLHQKDTSSLFNQHDAGTAGVAGAYIGCIVLVLLCHCPLGNNSPYSILVWMNGIGKRLLSKRSH